MSHYSRRTLVRGVAWSVPVVAVAANAPAFATSHDVPPPPIFDFTKGYKNPGNKCTSACIPKGSYGVPVTVTNQSGEDFYIQFTSYFIGATDIGVFGLTTGIVGCPKSFPACSPGGQCVTTPPLTASNSVCVPSGTTLTIYVTSNENGSSEQTSQAIDYKWIRKSDCSVASTGRGTSPTSPPNDVC
ncbi:hypothetical protein SAMN05192575_101983 [Nocardioides alpinus]|uniref:Ig-like domain-containing protein n=2 Tax=Nocardioides alpinus TaxID=748909 RepID=A0A1I0WGH0_9ACTN|nr:hypothetical protein CXG46_21225 [Nocardioides alpinus]SFA87664.1 hypothetical protein SAMN05192575_101983 [Nocardioides alpinus]